jgi:hypothetical protein
VADAESKVALVGVFVEEREMAGRSPLVDERDEIV